MSGPSPMSVPRAHARGMPFMAAPVTKGFRELAGKTAVAYVRMASTVIVAVVCRLCLDCAGLILTAQEPLGTAFWFAHCREDGVCVMAALSLVLTSLVGCSVFAWTCADWITDPEKNPYARRYSFAIIVEAATWIPISVSVGKTNAVVEWCMGIARDNVLQAVLSSAVAAVLTLLCAAVTHLVMNNCQSVQRSASVKEAGFGGFCKFLLLATLSSLGWAVAWSNWELVLSVMDALEPGRSMHNAVISGGVISVFLAISTCFYMRYGPEPIIPDPCLQQVCYNHGYSSSLRRALKSYMVYSCVVFIVMCACDPTYGLLISVARGLYTSDYAVFDATALLVLCVIACAVTAVAALCSAAITWWMEVDENSSMKLSRSVHNRCEKIVSSRRRNFDSTLLQVLKNGSDAQLVEALREQDDGSPDPVSPERWQHEGVGMLDGGGDSSPPSSLGQAAGYGSSVPYHLFGEEGHNSPDRTEPSMAAPDAAAPAYRPWPKPFEPQEEEFASERQFFLVPVRITAPLCASVLAYDVLGFVVCFQWGALVMRLYSVIFGRIAGIHGALYAASCLVYAALVVAGVSRFVFSYFPSAEELACAPAACAARRASNVGVGLPPPLPKWAEQREAIGQLSSITA